MQNWNPSSKSITKYKYHTYLPGQDLNEEKRIFAKDFHMRAVVLNALLDFFVQSEGFKQQKLILTYLWECDKNFCLLHKIMIDKEGLSYDDVGADLWDKDTPPRQGLEGKMQRPIRETNPSIEILNGFLSYSNSPEGAVD